MKSFCRLEVRVFPGTASDTLFISDSQRQGDSSGSGSSGPWALQKATQARVVSQTETEVSAGVYTDRFRPSSAPQTHTSPHSHQRVLVSTTATLPAAFPPGCCSGPQNKQTHGERTALSRIHRCFPSHRTWTHSVQDNAPKFRTGTVESTARMHPGWRHCVPFIWPLKSRLPMLLTLLPEGDSMKVPVLRPLLV